MPKNRWFGIRKCVLVYSGSSANLVALAALTSPALGDRALRVGDESITAAAGCPTKVNPIVQTRSIPVFIDRKLQTYNADIGQLEAALSPKTKAVILAHSLGNPFDAEAVRAFCRKHDLWLIEDTCDAVGATWGGQQVGTFNDLATVSFYPAHRMTIGEGGAVMMRSPELVNADFIMNDVFWVGTYPGIDDHQIDYLAESIIEAAAIAA